MKQAFLIVDIQNDYFDGGNMPLTGADSAADNARKALRHFRDSNTPVIHVKHIDIHNRLPFFKPDTFGVEIHESVKPIDSESVFIKHTPNAFHQTELLTHLQELGITDLIICGMMTHMCVDATTRAAKDFGFNIRLLEDACATTDLKFEGKTVSADLVHTSFIAAIDQYYAEVIKTKELIKN